MGGGGYWEFRSPTGLLVRLPVSLMYPSRLPLARTQTPTLLTQPSARAPDRQPAAVRREPGVRRLRCGRARRGRKHRLAVGRTCRDCSVLFAAEHRVPAR